jgi:hypothetical protein
VRTDYDAAHIIVDATNSLDAKRERLNHAFTVFAARSTRRERPSVELVDRER